MVLGRLKFSFHWKRKFSSHTTNTHTQSVQMKDFSIFTPRDCHIPFLASTSQSAIGKTRCPEGLADVLKLEQI